MRVHLNAPPFSAIPAGAAIATIVGAFDGDRSNAERLLLTTVALLIVVATLCFLRTYYLDYRASRLLYVRFFGTVTTSLSAHFMTIRKLDGRWNDGHLEFGSPYGTIRISLSKVKGGHVWPRSSLRRLVERMSADGVAVELPVRDFFGIDAPPLTDQPSRAPV
jgi:hypothetical protein